MNKRTVIIIGIGFLIVGMLLGVLGSFIALKKYPGFVCSRACAPTITSDRIFYSDEIVVYGEDNNDKPILLNLNLNSKRTAGKYLHYYYSSVSVGDYHNQDFTTFQSDEGPITSHDFLTNFKNTPAADLSTQETFSFGYDNKPVSLTVESDNLAGDFITKNSLEFTRYVSEGSAKLKIGENIFDVRIAVIKTYSTDYSKYLYFDGYFDFPTTSQQFILWDEQNNFYLVDQTENDGTNPYYKPHTWVLYKNAKWNSMQKAFDADLKTTFKDDGPNKWEMSVVLFNANLSLDSVTNFSNDKHSGIAAGTISSPDFSGKLGGYFAYATLNQ